MKDASDLPGLLLRLDTCVWSIERELPVDSATYSDLVARVQALAPVLPDAERAALAARVDRVLAALRLGQAGITARLRGARAGRRAVSAYADRAGIE